MDGQVEDLDFKPVTIELIDEDDDQELEITYIGPSSKRSSDNVKKSDHKSQSMASSPAEVEPLETMGATGQSQKRSKPNSTIALASFEATTQQLNRWLTCVRHSKTKVPTPIGSPNHPSMKDEKPVTNNDHVATSAPRFDMVNDMVKSNMNCIPVDFSVPTSHITATTTTNSSIAMESVVTPVSTAEFNTLMEVKPINTDLNSSHNSIPPVSKENTSAKPLSSQSQRMELPPGKVVAARTLEIAQKIVLQPTPAAIASCQALSDPSTFVFDPTTGSDGCGSMLQRDESPAKRQTVISLTTPNPSPLPPPRVNSPIVIRTQQAPTPRIPQNRNILPTMRNLVPRQPRYSACETHSLPPTSSLPWWRESSDFNNDVSDVQSGSAQVQGQRVLFSPLNNLDPDATLNLIKSFSDIEIQKTQKSLNSLPLTNTGVVETSSIGRAECHQAINNGIMNLFSSSLDDRPNSAASQLMTFYSSNSGEADADGRIAVIGNETNRESIQAMSALLQQTIHLPIQTSPLNSKESHNQRIRDMGLQPVFQVPATKQRKPRTAAAKGARSKKSLLQPPVPTTSFQLPSSYCALDYRVNSSLGNMPQLPQMSVPSLPSFSASFSHSSIRYSTSTVYSSCSTSSSNLCVSSSSGALSLANRVTSLDLQNGKFQTIPFTVETQPIFQQFEYPESDKAALQAMRATWGAKDSKDVIQKTGEIAIISPVASDATSAYTSTSEATSDSSYSPKRKYNRKPKLDAEGNPVPPKPRSRRNPPNVSEAKKSVSVQLQIPSKSKIQTAINTIALISSDGKTVGITSPPVPTVGKVKIPKCVDGKAVAPRGSKAAPRPRQPKEPGTVQKTRSKKLDVVPNAGKPQPKRQRKNNSANEHISGSTSSSTKTIAKSPSNDLKNGKSMKQKRLDANIPANNQNFAKAVLVQGFTPLPTYPYMKLQTTEVQPPTATDSSSRAPGMSKSALITNAGSAEAVCNNYIRNLAVRPHISPSASAAQLTPFPQRFLVPASLNPSMTVTLERNTTKTPIAPGSNDALLLRSEGCSPFSLTGKSYSESLSLFRFSQAENGFMPVPLSPSPSLARPLVPCSSDVKTEINEPTKKGKRANHVPSHKKAKGVAKVGTERRLCPELTQGVRSSAETDHLRAPVMLCQNSRIVEGETGLSTGCNFTSFDDVITTFPVSPSGNQFEQCQDSGESASRVMPSAFIFPSQNLETGKSVPPLAKPSHTEAVLFKPGGALINPNMSFPYPGSACTSPPEKNPSSFMTSQCMTIERLLAAETASRNEDVWKSNHVKSTAGVTFLKTEDGMSPLIQLRGPMNNSTLYDQLTITKAENAEECKNNKEFETEIQKIEQSMEQTTLGHSSEKFEDERSSSQVQVSQEAVTNDSEASGRRISRRSTKYVKPALPKVKALKNAKHQDPTYKLVRNPGHRWMFTEREIALVLSDGRFVMKRADAGINVEQLTVWKVIDSGAPTLALKAYEPYSKKNSNRFFHLSNWTERDGNDTRVFGAETILLEKNLREIFLHYLPVYVDPICDTPELSLVKVYRDDRLIQHIPYIYKQEACLKEAYYNLIRTVLCQAMDPTFMDRVIYDELQHPSAEITQLRTGWFRIHELIMRMCEEIAAPRTWLHKVLDYIKRFPKMTFSGKNIRIDQSCAGCPQGKSNTLMKGVTFDGIPYDYQTLMPNPDSHPSNDDKPNPGLQVCASCRVMLKNFHTLYHTSYILLATIHFRLELITDEFPPDTIFDSLSVKEAIDADIDWYKWMLLDFLAVLSQSQSYIERWTHVPNRVFNEGGVNEM